MGRKTAVWIFQEKKNGETAHENTWIWLRKKNFKKESKSILIASQNNAIRTKYIKGENKNTES